MRKVLVVVDMQKDFIDGALGFEGADKIIPGIISKIRDFEGSGDEIVYTLDTHFENYMETQEGKNLPVPHCIKGSDGWGLCNELKPLLEGKKCFEKLTFGSVELAEYLKENASEISSIEVCGGFFCSRSSSGNARCLKGNTSNRIIILQSFAVL